MSEIKLVPCPICNGKANIENVFGRNGVICEDCDLMYRGKYEESVEEVVKKWNTRKPMESILKKLRKKEELEVVAGVKGSLEEARLDGYVKGIKKAIEVVKKEGGIE